MDEAMRLALETAFDATADAMLLIYPPDEIKARLDARAAKLADQAADAAERLKFGGQP